MRTFGHLVEAGDPAQSDGAGESENLLAFCW